MSINSERPYNLAKSALFYNDVVSLAASKMLSEKTIKKTWFKLSITISCGIVFTNPLLLSTGFKFWFDNFSLPFLLLISVAWSWALIASLMSICPKYEYKECVIKTLPLSLACQYITSVSNQKDIAFIQLDRSNVYFKTSTQPITLLAKKSFICLSLIMALALISNVAGIFFLNFSDITIGKPLILLSMLHPLLIAFTAVYALPTLSYLVIHTYLKRSLSIEHTFSAANQADYKTPKPFLFDQLKSVPPISISSKTYLDDYNSLENSAERLDDAIVTLKRLLYHVSCILDLSCFDKNDLKLFDRQMHNNNVVFINDLSENVVPAFIASINELNNYSATAKRQAVDRLLAIINTHQNTLSELISDYEAIYAQVEKSKVDAIVKTLSLKHIGTHPNNANMSIQTKVLNQSINEEIIPELNTLLLDCDDAIKPRIEQTITNLTQLMQEKIEAEQSLIEQSRLKIEPLISIEHEAEQKSAIEDHLDYIDHYIDNIKNHWH